MFTHRPRLLLLVACSLYFAQISCLFNFRLKEGSGRLIASHAKITIFCVSKPLWFGEKEKSNKRNEQVYCRNDTNIKNNAFGHATLKHLAIGRSWESGGQGTRAERIKRIEAIKILDEFDKRTDKASRRSSFVSKKVSRIQHFLKPKFIISAILYFTHPVCMNEDYCPSVCPFFKVFFLWL